GLRGAAGFLALGTAAGVDATGSTGAAAAATGVRRARGLRAGFAPSTGAIASTGAGLSTVSDAGGASSVITGFSGSFCATGVIPAFSLISATILSAAGSLGAITPVG